MLKGLTFVVALLCFYIARTQNALPTDSAYRVIKAQSVHRNQVNWQEVDTAFANRLQKAKTAIDSVKCLVYVFKQLKDVHSMIFYQGANYSNYPDLDEVTRARLWPLINRSQKVSGKFYTQVLSGQVLYIFLPGIRAWGDQATVVAQALSDSLCKHANSGFKGIILDLRLNGGGQISSMLSGLNQLLGNNYLSSSVDDNNQEKYRFEIKDQNLYMNNYPMTSQQNKCKLYWDRMPVVVLTSSATVSSGSITAIAFKQRPNTYFMGEATASGYTTGNDFFNIGNGLTLNMATSYNRDRAGIVYRDRVPVDEEITTGYDFDQLQNDAAVTKAIKWLLARKK
jgi:carboxyl-terminal processing protease